MRLRSTFYFCLEELVDCTAPRRRRRIQDSGFRIQRDTATHYIAARQLKGLLTRWRVGEKGREGAGGGGGVKNRGAWCLCWGGGGGGGESGGYCTSDCLQSEPE